MYDVVVVGTDGSSTAEKAVEIAAAMSRRWGATLHIVTAYQLWSSGMASAMGAPLVDTANDAMLREEEAKHIGEKAIASWCDQIDAEAHAIGGDIVGVILDTARSVGADLIVVGNKGMTGVRRVLGSVPNSVCHRAECSVMVVKTN